MMDVHVVPAKAFGVIGVQVVDDREAGCPCSLEKGVTDGQARIGSAQRHRAHRTVPIARAAEVRLGSQKVGASILKAPAVASHIAPLIVFAGMPAGIDHAVYAAGTPHHLAFEQNHLPVMERGNRLEKEVPVVFGDRASSKPQAWHTQEGTVILIHRSN